MLFVCTNVKDTFKAGFSAISDLAGRSPLLPSRHTEQRGQQDCEKTTTRALAITWWLIRGTEIYIYTHTQDKGGKQERQPTSQEYTQTQTHTQLKLWVIRHLMMQELRPTGNYYRLHLSREQTEGTCK